MKKVLAVVFMLCAGALSAQGLNVISYTPKGNTYSTENVDINVTFNKPVVRLGDSNQFGNDACPIKLVPAAKGNCRWTGTQTLSFEAEKLIPSTEYKVTVDGNLKSEVSSDSLSREFSWTFNTPRINFSHSRPADAELWVGLNPNIFLVFNQPVNPQTAREYISFKKSNEAAQLSFDLIRPSKEAVKQEYGGNYYQAENMLVLMPKAKLEQAASYNIKIAEGMPGEQGTLGFQKEKNIFFYTYENFAVIDTNSPKCLPGNTELRFTNPVYLKDVVDNIKISPSVKFKPLEEGAKYETGSRIYNGPTGYALPFNIAEFEPGKTYKITLDANLKDIYGNKLGQKKTLTYTHPQYCPNVDFSTGFGVLESYLPIMHPVDVINVEATGIDSVKLNNAQEFIKAYKEGNTYCKNTTVPAYGSYAFKTKRNQTLRTGFDLNKIFNGNAKGFNKLTVFKKRDNGDYCRTDIFDNVTDVGVTLKTGIENSLIWVTTLRDGKPVANKSVELYSGDGELLWSGKTEGNGMAEAPGFKELGVVGGRWDRPEVYAIAYSDGGDAIVSSNWTQGVEPWRFNISYDWYPKEITNNAAVFFDRDILRPGEKLNLKGALRTLKEGDWAIPSISTVTLRVSDPAGNEWKLVNAPVNTKYGTFETTFNIGSADKTGTYSVELVNEEDEGSADYFNVYKSFRVEALKPAEFKVNVNTDKPDYRSQDNAVITVDGSYMFGGPLAGADVKLAVRYTENYYRNSKYSDYFFNSYDDSSENYPYSEQTNKLDNNGRFVYTQALPKFDRPYRMFVEAGITAPNRQQLFSRTSTPVHPSEFYIGIKTGETYTEVEKPFGADILTVNPVTNEAVSAKVTAKIENWQYYSIRKTGINGRLEWVSENRVESTDTVTFTTGKTAHAFKYTPKTPGSYKVTFTAVDDKGNEVRNTASFSVAGKGRAYWAKNDDDIIKLVADKATYKVGDKAKLMVQSPYANATALVTVEREKIMHKFTQELKGGADSIVIPVTEDYLPNAFVSVILIKGRSAENSYDKEGLDLGKPQLKVGYANLTVEPEARKIATKLTTDKATYLPGETVTINLHNTVNGKAVESEVAVFVVDEGVLSLTAYKTPDLFNEFYGPRALAVGTVDTRAFVIGQRSFGEKGENRGGGGGDDSKLGGIDLRTNFDMAPYWNGKVFTDKDGKAKVQFKLPDNLTKFRVMAVSLNTKQFGSADTNITVNKPVMIKPSLPRFARLGDIFKCGVIVYNQDAKEDITVKGIVSGGVAMYGGESTVNAKIEKGGFKEILWNCQAANAQPAVFEFTAASGKDTDGLRWNIPINGIEKYYTLATSGVTESKVKEGMKAPTGYVPFADNRAEFTFASTALVGLKEGLFYMLSYPYGCLEQKMSKILPVILSKSIVSDFKLGNISNLEAAAQEVISNIGAYQSSDGGFKYWADAYSTQPDPFVTLYALEVLHLAKEKGYKVDDNVSNKALKWLDSFMSASDTKRWAYPYSRLENKTTQAYAAYVLSLYKRGAAASFQRLTAAGRSSACKAKPIL
ncbi:hypothetical protein AAIR98_001057 [Elusimicrobium simillimum]|uniref:alpha-2-macroglobulin family protein n=1 Tax=Elusimicrobium simillimum TaxID=3143438 RepID=UPI003C6ED84A